jgi:DNA polymerase III alpha subunit
MNYELIKKSVEKGGMITNTGRGSAVSFYTNKLLGFTKVDRISAKVKMYPERFMSATRILEAKTLADIDFNVGNPEVFAETQKELFGEECAYPMIAYGKYKASSAFKMYAKAKKVPFETANIITSQIKQYEKDLSHAEDDEKDDIQLLDYIDEQYHQILEDSERYLGIISSWSPHPCAHLIYQGDIRKEIGLVMMPSDQGKKFSRINAGNAGVLACFVALHSSQW